VEDGEQGERSDQVQDLTQELGDLMTEHRLERRTIRGEAARQLARAPFRVEPGRQREQVREQLGSQAGDHALRRRAEKEYLHEIEHRLCGEHDEQ